MTLLYYKKERKLSKAEESERVLYTASPVTWSRDKTRIIIIEIQKYSRYSSVSSTEDL
jgi:hypothetical protein